MRQSAKDGVTVFMAYENEVPIGTMELCDIDPVQKTGRICRVLFAEEVRGKGLAHIALSALCAKAFDELGLETLSLRVYCFNLLPRNILLPESRAAHSSGWQAD